MQIITTEKRFAKQPELSALVRGSNGLTSDQFSARQHPSGTGTITLVHQHTATLWLQPLGWVVGTAILACLVGMVIMRLFKQPDQPSPPSIASPSPSPLRATFAHSGIELPLLMCALTLFQ